MTQALFELVSESLARVEFRGRKRGTGSEFMLVTSIPRDSPTDTESEETCPGQIGAVHDSSGPFPYHLPCSCVTLDPRDPEV